MSLDDPLLVQVEPFSKFLESQPHALISENSELRDASLKAAKFFFDLAINSESQSIPPIQALLDTLSPEEAPQTRSQSLKRKRSPTPQSSLTFASCPLSSLYIEDQDEAQLWSQVDLRTNALCQLLDRAILQGEDQPDQSLSDGGGSPHSDAGSEDEMDGNLQDMESSSDASSDEDEENESEDEESMDGDSEALGERTAELQDPSDDEESDGSTDDLDATPGSAFTSRKGRNSELDDGFFQLADFNAEIHQAEARTVSSGRLDDDEDDEDAEFDLFTSLDDDHAMAEDLGEGEEPYYQDFFDPPPQERRHKPKTDSPQRKGKKNSVRFNDKVRIKNIKARGKGAPVSTVYDDDDDDDDSEAESEDEEDEDYNSNSDSGDPGSSGEMEEGDPTDDDEASESGDSDEIMGPRMDELQADLFGDDDSGIDEEDDSTNHEKRVSMLRQQIAELEADNVGEKDWVLMGEATSRSRPQNSLLEEHLEFERIAKTAPIVTEEAVQSLEEKIKARILSGDFDDVVRRRPIEDRPFLQSRAIELADKKSADSLAQVYEKEYMAQRDGSSTDHRDEKLLQEHREIEAEWENISSKLDALCNAHYTPKEPKAIITTISNVATASLESALPTIKSASTMLAPEEVFRPDSSDPRARSELTPQEKRALFRKTRKSRKKARDALAKTLSGGATARTVGSVKKQKQEALKGVVKKGKGVTVIGKEKKEAAETKKKKRPSRQ